MEDPKLRPKHEKRSTGSLALKVQLVITRLDFQDKTDGPFYRFYEVIMDAGGDFLSKITHHRDVTLFVPSNSAWNESYLDKIIADKEKLREILDLHLVTAKLPLEVIIRNNAKEVNFKSF